MPERAPALSPWPADPQQEGQPACPAVRHVIYGLSQPLWKTRLFRTQKPNHLNSGASLFSFAFQELIE